MAVGILAGITLQTIWSGLPREWGVMTVFTYWGGHGAATATLDLNFFAAYLAPILIHMAVIIVFMSFVCMVLMRRWFGKDWFPLALMFFGAGCGSTPSGLALARCVDPDVKTGSWEAFGVAQGCFVPFTSTFVAIWPVLAVKNLWILVEIGAAVSIASIAFNEILIRKGAPE